MSEPERVMLEGYFCGKCGEEVTLVDGWWSCGCYRIGAHELDCDFHEVPPFWYKLPDLWFTFDKIDDEMQGGPLSDPNQEKIARARLVEDWVTLYNFTGSSFKQEEQLKTEIARLSKALSRLTNSSPALASVVLEREKQDAKWGEQNHDPFTYLTILMEEVGELSQAALHTRFGGDYGGLEHMREEAVQTAAVALAIVECLDRAKWQWADLPKAGES